MSERISTLVQSFEAKANDIVSPDFLRHELTKGYELGFETGESTGMACLDANLRLVKKGIYLFFGVPNMGKSEFVRAICLHKAIKNGWKSVVYCYEEESFKWLNKIIWGYLGKTTMRKYLDQCTRTEFENGMNFALKHFQFVYPESGDFTIDNIEKQYTKLIKNAGADIAVLDPINQVELPPDSDSNKWSSFYMNRKHFARQNNLCYFLVAHPPKVGKGNDGEFPALDLYDVSGGAMHANKVDCMINYHRPFFVNNKKNPLCEIRVLKVKDVDCFGQRGTVEMNFDFVKNRYTDMYSNDYLDYAE